MRASVLLASALASPLLAATRSVTPVVPPPRSLATFERWTPGCDDVCGLDAVPEMFFLPFGSHARTLTVCGCWTPVMRGRNEIRVSCHLSTTGLPLVLLAG